MNKIDEVYTLIARLIGGVTAPVEVELRRILQAHTDTVAANAAANAAPVVHPLSDAEISTIRDALRGSAANAAPATPELVHAPVISSAAA